MKHLTDSQLQLLIDEPHENQALHQHIQECSQCRSTYELLLEVHIHLSNMEYEKPSMRFAKNIYEIIVRKQQLEVQEMRWIRNIRFSIISSVFLILILSFYFIITLHWDLPIQGDAILVYYKWSITMLSSVIMVWIFYGIDNWYGGRLKG